MKPVVHSHNRSARRAAALLAVLWVVSLLIALVAGASLLIVHDLELSSIRRQVFRARMLGEAALAIALNPDIKPDDPLLRGQPAPDERFEVELTKEEGRLNPNVLLGAGDRETLRRVFRYWGMNVQQSDALIAALLDWVDPDDFVNPPFGAESKAYGRNGLPFNRPFRSIEEMSLVRGMQVVEQAYPGWRSWFSVYSDGKLDVNEASPEMISAVTGADIRLAQQLRSMRLGRDGIANTQDDSPHRSVSDALTLLQIVGTQQQQALGALLSVEGGTRRIIVKVQVGDLQRRVAVVARGAAAQGTNAILWMGEE